MPRFMKVGATYPALRGMATDETGAALNLSTALELDMMAISPTHTIVAVPGNTTAIWPATADPDGVHFWNWQYTWAVGDTVQAGVYNVYLKVTWTSGQIEFFPADGAETLTIEAVD